MSHNYVNIKLNFNGAFCDKLKDIIIQYKKNKHSTLSNKCNKCWLNAAIQMIGYIDSLVDDIINLPKNSDKNIENIRKLFNDLVKENKIINYGTDFKDSDPGGYGNLYNFFYNNQNIMKGTVGNFEDSQEGLIKVLNYFFDTLKIDNNDIKHKVIIERQCLFSDYKSESNEFNTIFPLECPQSPQSPLTELNEYINNMPEEIVNDRNNYLDGCSEENKKTKRGPFKITTKIYPNKYFIIQLKLFKYINLKSTKITPNLNISKILEINNNKYYLSGFILHIGNTLSGIHYVFYKILPDGSGYLYDDDSFITNTKNEIDDILTKNNQYKTPYILLYEKIETTIDILQITYDKKLSEKLKTLQDKLDCYSTGIIKQNIYTPITFDKLELVFIGDILCYKIIQNDTDKTNIKLFKNTLYNYLFDKAENKYNDDNEIYMKLLYFYTKTQKEKDDLIKNINSELIKIDKTFQYKFYVVY
jgi:hypothetical protein